MFILKCFSLTNLSNLTTSVYDFEGKVLLTKNYHDAGSGKITTVINRMEYDVKGRLVKVFQNNNAAPTDQLVALYEYNELGQVVDKKLHNTSGSNFLQSVDYRYTILGQLSSINNSQLTVDDKNDDGNDFFGMEYLYNQVDAGLGNTALYDGNMSAIKYKGPCTAPGVADQHGYKFQYDKAGQLKSGTSKKYGTTGWDKEDNVLAELLWYDYNGNITQLIRNGRKYEAATNEYVSHTIDNLTYTYNAGDQLIKVEDAADDVTGFTNGVNTATEYTYDTHGSVTADLNKGISAITYNILGKPSVITFSDGKRIEYTYDAAGAKLTMKTFEGATLKLTQDYVDNFIYENGALSFFSSPEGRVVKKGGALEYQYALTDHQGNTRVLFTSAPSTAQTASASMEDTTNANFENYTNRSDFDLMDHTDPATVNTYSQKLTGGNNSLIGLAKNYAVYTGDKVKIEAYAKYFNPQSTSSNVTGFATALTSAFGLSAASTGEALKAYNALSNYGGVIASGGGHTDNGYPKLYVNILLFDKNFNLVDATYQQIDGGEQPIGEAAKLPHDYMSAEITVKEPGYAYAYISHENATLVEGYFDDIVMTYTPTNIIQYNEYYAFGLQTTNSWTRENNTNNFLYNQGSELNKTTNWYEMFYRSYDPALGRMMQVDPYAAMYSSYSTYNYTMNNPIVFSDPSGGYALAKNEKLEPDQEARQGGGGSAYYIDSRGAIISSNGGFGGGGSSNPFDEPGSINAWAENVDQMVHDHIFGVQNGSGYTTSDPKEIEGIVKAITSGSLFIGNGHVSTLNIEINLMVAIDGDGNPIDGTERGTNYMYYESFELDDMKALSQSNSRSSGCLTCPGGIQYNENLDRGLSVAGGIGGAFETGGSISLLQMTKGGNVVKLADKAKYLGAVRYGKVLGHVGIGLTVAIAVHELATDHHNTHTWVDLGVTGMLFGAGVVFGTAALPAVAVVGQAMVFGRLPVVVIG